MDNTIIIKKIITHIQKIDNIIAKYPNRITQLPALRGYLQSVLNSKQRDKINYKEITFSKLKQIADSFTWELYNYSDDNNPCNNLHHKYINIERKVAKKQTNAIMFDNHSWLYWSKAENYTFSKYLYNNVDIILTIKEKDIPFMGYHLRPITNTN